jgi:hypothetical protein
LCLLYDDDDGARPSQKIGRNYVNNTNAFDGLLSIPYLRTYQCRYVASQLADGASSASLQQNLSKTEPGLKERLSLKEHISGPKNMGSKLMEEHLQQTKTV